MSNVCPIFKGGNPSIPSHYRPVSLLNTIEKVLEKTVFNYTSSPIFCNLFFFTPFQSGFLPGDSTVNQPMLLYHNICKALDNRHEFCIVFFDVSKAFDKVWHKGILFKLYHAGVQGRLLEWLTDYPSNRYQRVVLNGSYSDLSFLKASVPQECILGPLLFLVYINDIVDNLEININLFADDTSLSLETDNPDSCWAKLQSDVNKINDWAQNWIVKFNPLKSESLVNTR